MLSFPNLNNIQQRSILHIIKLLLDQHRHSTHDQRKPKIVSTRNISTSPQDEHSRQHAHHNRYTGRLHQFYRDYHCKQQHHSEDEHHSPLKQRGYYQFGSWKEDREPNTAKEDELMGDGVGVAASQLEKFGVNIAEDKSWQELPQFTDRIVVFHQKGADDDGGEEDAICSHLAAPGKLPINGEYNPSGAIPSEVHTEQHPRQRQHAQHFQSTIKGLDGQVGHELVLADDPGVVDDEGCQAGHEGVLDHRQGKVVRHCYVEDHEKRGQDDEGQFGECDCWLATELLVFEIERVYWLDWQFGLGGCQVFVGDQGSVELFAHCEQL